MAGAPWPHDLSDPVAAIHRALDPDCPWSNPEHCTEYSRIRRIVEAHNAWRAHYLDYPADTVKYHLAIFGSSPIEVTETEPIQELAVAPDSLADVFRHCGLDQQGAPLRLQRLLPPGAAGDRVTLPWVVDPTLPPRTIHLRPAPSKENPS
ncbi:hypothetical protein [Streptomyces albidoflavus]|uniref:hypothetical protein n=1 Tax=Streptomyces albidoflavus TaxID=1886 RepID=UPI0033E57713